MILPDHAEQLAHYANSILSGNIQTEHAERNLPVLLLSIEGMDVTTSTFDPSLSEQFVPNNDRQHIAVLKIEGTLTKHDQFCGPAGYETYGQILSALDKDSSILGVILSIDSPGGQVSGLATLADQIKAFTKPINAFVSEGLCCSAAYYLAASCNEIYASQPTDIVGSIGVMMQVADLSGRMAKEGIKVHTIYSSYSNQKNEHARQILEGQYDTFQKTMLDPIALRFINHVKSSRSIDASKGNPFQGAVFMAPQAVEIGLINGIQSLQQLALSMGNKATNNPPSQQSQSEMKITPAHAALAAAFGITFSENETEVEFQPTAEQITALNNTLAQLQQQQAAAESSQAELRTQIQGLESQRDSLTAEVNTLKQRTSATPSSTTSQSDPAIGPTEDFATSFDTRLNEDLAAFGVMKD